MQNVHFLEGGSTRITGVKKHHVRGVRDPWSQQKRPPQSLSFQLHVAVIHPGSILALPLSSKLLSFSVPLLYLYNKSKNTCVLRLMRELNDIKNAKLSAQI